MSKVDYNNNNGGGAFAQSQPIYVEAIAVDYNQPQPVYQQPQPVYQQPAQVYQQPPQQQPYNPMQQPTSQVLEQHAASHEANVKEFLNTNHWPLGLQNFLLKNVVKMPYRFFICDDSGSMSSSDGKQMDPTTHKVIKCSRWAEMTTALKFHANLSQKLDLPSEFRMLNSAAPIVIGGPQSQPDSLDRFYNVLNNSPGGGTPLCHHIREVTAQIKLMEPSLRANGQRVAIVIMTDGEASDGDLAAAMRPLHNLPVWVVVRLCTDSDDVGAYWDRVDETLELELDVLDDLFGESEEVHSKNPWLSYCEPIHRLREFGVHMKEMDLLDESLLSKEQLRAVCAMLFNQPVSNVPHPEASFGSFVNFISASNNSCDKVYSIPKRKLRNLVDETLLHSCYRRSACTIS